MSKQRVTGVMIKEVWKEFIWIFTKWIYPKCDYCNARIIDWGKSKSYKNKIYHSKCLHKHKGGLYK